MNKTLFPSKAALAGFLLFFIAQATPVQSFTDSDAKDKISSELTKIYKEHPVATGVFAGAMLPIQSVAKAVNKTPTQIRAVGCFLAAIFIAGQHLGK